jgi:hypothetical protein
VSVLEFDAALAAAPGAGLLDLLSACAVANRRVAVVSDLSEDAVMTALRAHRLHGRIGAVAARQGLDLDLAIR